VPPPDPPFSKIGAVLFGGLLPVSDQNFTGYNLSQLQRTCLNIPNDFENIVQKNLVEISRFYLLHHKIPNKKKPASLENTGFSYLPVTCW